MTDEPSIEDLSIEALLKNTEALSKDPQLVPIARSIFDYAQFLLDDDSKLTKTGNLTSAAKKSLRERALELLEVEQESDTEADSQG